MAMKRPRINAWDPFTKDGEYASCLITGCKARVKHCSNTSNPLKHLQSCHHKEHEKCIAERQTNSKKEKGKYSNDSPGISVFFEKIS